MKSIFIEYRDNDGKKMRDLAHQKQEREDFFRQLVQMGFPEENISFSERGITVDISGTVLTVRVESTPSGPRASLRYHEIELAYSVKRYNDLLHGGWSNDTYVVRPEALKQLPKEMRIPFDEQLRAIDEQLEILFSKRKLVQSLSKLRELNATLDTYNDLWARELPKLNKAEAFLNERQDARKKSIRGALVNGSVLLLLAAGLTCIGCFMLSAAAFVYLMIPLIVIIAFFLIRTFVCLGDLLTINREITSHLVTLNVIKNEVQAIRLKTCEIQLARTLEEGALLSERNVLIQRLEEALSLNTEDSLQLLAFRDWDWWKRIEVELDHAYETETAALEKEIQSLSHERAEVRSAFRQNTVTSRPYPNLASLAENLPQHSVLVRALSFFSAEPSCNMTERVMVLTHPT